MRDRLIALGILGASFGLGAMVGHYWTKRRLEMEFYGKMDAELDAARKYYTKLAKRDEYADPVEVVEFGKPGDEVTFGEIGPENFRMRDEDATPRLEGQDEYSYFNYRQEVPKRTAEVPYVISYEEFFENEKEHDQQTLIYFSKDDVLVEERDSPVEDPLALIGPTALEQFGNGSKDPNIVYIRNERIEMDFEVCYDPDSFEETVLGHIKHGEHRKVPKFRIDDE